MPGFLCAWIPTWGALLTQPWAPRSGRAAQGHNTLWPWYTSQRHTPGTGAIQSISIAVLRRSVLSDPMDCSPPGSSVHGDSPGENTGVACHALLQGIFPTQGSNPGLPHCRPPGTPSPLLGSLICSRCEIRNRKICRPERSSNWAAKWGPEDVGPKPWNELSAEGWEEVGAESRGSPRCTPGASPVTQKWALPGWPAAQTHPTPGAARRAPSAPAALQSSPRRRGGCRAQAGSHRTEPGLLGAGTFAATITLAARFGLPVCFARNPGSPSIFCPHPHTSV